METGALSTIVVTTIRLSVGCIDATSIFDAGVIFAILTSIFRYTNGHELKKKNVSFVFLQTPYTIETRLSRMGNNV